jgi:hypothetical protein
MKIGDYVTVEDIMNQSACKWVVLVDLVTDDDEAAVLGGTVKIIEDTKTAASRKAKPLYDADIDTLLVPGALGPSVIVGGVFVD